MGNRFFDENCERILNGQKRRYRRHRAKLCSTRGRCPERPRRRRNPDCYTGKRATTGRERGAPVREARILGSMGVVVGVVDFCGRGAVRGEGIGTRGSGWGGRGRGRERGGFWGRGVGFITRPRCATGNGQEAQWLGDAKSSVAAEFWLSRRGGMGGG